MIDLDIKNFINKFSEEHGKNVIAAVLFGSSLHKTEGEIRDIDLLLVLEDNSVFRGNYYCSNVRRIDYFAGSTSILQEQLDKSRGTTDTLLFHMLGEGKVLFGEDKTLNLVTTAKDYLATFNKYADKENTLKVLWYKLTDAYDDLLKESDPMVNNLLLAQIISLSMEFYCVYHGELMKKRGTSNRESFYELHGALLVNQDSKKSAGELVSFLSKETDFNINNNWEVQYQ